MYFVTRGFLGAFIASYGFGVLYNIRDKGTLFCAALTGAVGGGVYEAFLTLKFSTAMASFAGAFAFSLFAELFARALKRPAIIFNAPALIPLVPGGDVYRMMNAFIRGDIYSGWMYGLDALTIAGLLAVAVMVVSSGTRLFVRIWRRRKRERSFMK